MRRLILLLVLINSGQACEPLSLSQNAFVSAMREAILEANQNIAIQRAKVLHLQAQPKLNAIQQQYLSQLATHYRFAAFHTERPLSWRALLARIDSYPVDLVLTQAALESNWGQSRFAVLGHSYFGMWCFELGCGMIPEHRPKGRHYAVKRYTSMLASVIDYMHTLNTHPAYRPLRVLRYQIRQAGDCLAGADLLPGLTAYAERSDYIDLLRRVREDFCLDRYTDCRTSASEGIFYGTRRGRTLENQIS